MSVSDRNRTIRWPGDPAGLTPEAVDFEAVAHVLGNTCSWGGRTPRFYSVAQHALTVCTAVQALGGMDDENGRSLALHALLGDAWRAWLPDRTGADASAKAMEKHARGRDAVQRAVLEAAGAPAELPQSWDRALELTRLRVEATLVRDLAGGDVDRVAQRGGPLFPPLKKRTAPMRPDVAAKRWLEALRAADLRAADLRAAESRAQAPGAPGSGAQAPGGEA